MTELVWTPEMTARFWQLQNLRPHEFFSYQVGRVILRRFRRYLHGRVLDYGSGPAYLVEDLEALGFHPDAFDIGNPAPAPALGRYDTIFLLEVIEHLYDPQLRDVLSTILNLLTHGGHLILTTPNEEQRHLSMIPSPESGQWFHRYQHVRSWTAESLARTLRLAGFHVIECASTDFGAHPLAHSRTKNLPTRLARAIALTALRRTPHLYAVAQRP